MNKLYTKTVFIKATTQYAEFNKLKIGHWVTGLTLNNTSQYYRGQFMGFDNDNKPIINMRIDNTKRPLNWTEQFKSNKPLRAFAIIKA